MSTGSGRSGLGRRLGGFVRRRGDICFVAVFHKFIFVICGGITLHNLQGVVVPLSDTLYNSRRDWWDWTTVRRLEIHKVGGKVTLGELEFQETDGLGGVISNDAVGRIDEDSLTVVI